MKQIYPTPSLILIRGLPGSGKSYLTEELVRRLGKESVMVLDPDLIDMQSEEYLRLKQELKGEGVEEKFHPNRYLCLQASRAIEAGKTVIWNQAFTHLGGLQRTIGRVQEYVSGHGINAPVLLIEVTIDPELAKARIAERSNSGGHDVPPENFQRFLDDYRSFANEGFNFVQINGEDDIEQSVQTILARLNDL